MGRLLDNQRTSRHHTNNEKKGRKEGMAEAEKEEEFKDKQQNMFLSMIDFDLTGLGEFGRIFLYWISGKSLARARVRSEVRSAIEISPSK